MRKPRKPALQAIFLLLALGFHFVCTSEPESQTPAANDFSDSERRSHIVLEVEGAFYLNSDFTQYTRQIAGEDFAELDGATLSRLFDSFVDEKILLADVRNRNITLTQEEKREYLVKFSSSLRPEDTRSPGSDTDDPDFFERLLIEKLIVGLVRDIAVSPEEITAYYDKNKREFLRSEQVRVSQILMESEDKAVEMLEKLKGADEEEFRRLAREASTGVEAVRGGAMGVFELGQLPYDMEKVIFALKEGEVSRVVESSYGYHIFRLDQKLEADLISEEAAKSDIEMKILDDKIKNFLSGYIETLKSDLDWTSYTQNLPFPYVRNANE